MLQRLIATGAMAVLLTASAFAQTAQVPQSASPDSPSLALPFKSNKPVTVDEVERRKAADRAYEAAMHKIPDKKVSADPWGDIRPGAAANTKGKQP
jgi:hypothetical protein